MSGADLEYQALLARLNNPDNKGLDGSILVQLINQDQIEHPGGGSGGSGGGNTNLSTVRANDRVTIVSNTGADAIIPLADSNLAGVFSPTDKVKIDTVSAGATANPDAVTLVDINDVVTALVDARIAELNLSSSNNIIDGIGTTLPASGSRIDALFCLKIVTP